jgi:hypothetical protein
MYILTQKEYDDLRAKQERQLNLADNKLQKLCTKIADTMPITIGKAWPGWENKPWGCVKTIEQDGDEWYCDYCPVYDICPSEYKPASK